MKENKATPRRVPLDKVGRLSIKEIAELWSKEINVPTSTLTRELQYAVLNLSSFREDGPLIERNLADSELPTPDTILTQQDIIDFCAKQGGWPRPNFWFATPDNGPGFAGRPSIMPAIIKELENRAQKGILKDSLSEEAAELSKWAANKFPTLQTPKPKSLANAIRSRFRELKRANN